MGSVSGGGSAQRERYNEDTWNNLARAFTESQNSSREGSTRANFDSPQGQQTLGFLSDQTQQGGGYQSQAGQTYNSLASLRGTPNPEVERIVSANNQEADINFGNRLAQSRAANYRGNTAAGLYDQDKIAAQFTNQQAGENAALRYGAFNDAQNRGLTANVAGAGGLAGLSGQSQGLGSQLLQLLRGTDAMDATQTDTNSNTIETQQGGRSGKKSGTKGFVEGSYDYT